MSNFAAHKQFCKSESVSNFDVPRLFHTRTVKMRQRTEIAVNFTRWTLRSHSGKSLRLREWYTVASRRKFGKVVYCSIRSKSCVLVGWLMILRLDLYFKITGKLYVKRKISLMDNRNGASKWPVLWLSILQIFKNGNELKHIPNFFFFA